MKMTYNKVNINSMHCMSTAYNKVKRMTKQHIRWERGISNILWSDPYTIHGVV